jgi:phosphoglycolate phosphatase-like HAD superfamily hydrolase
VKVRINIKKFKNVFLDFDGVIKDSVDVKSDIFEQLFSSFGCEVSRKVRLHHENNGGMSRFEKLPIYLKMTGEKPSNTLVLQYAEKFSKLVKKKVISSNWVDGVLEYLQKNYYDQKFFLITATPQQEIEEILKELKISQYFQCVIGSPEKKYNAMKTLLDKYNIDRKEVVMVGDSNADYSASVQNRITFVLRKTKLNVRLQEQVTCVMITDFIEVLYGKT